MNHSYHDYHFAPLALPKARKVRTAHKPRTTSRKPAGPSNYNSIVNGFHGLKLNHPAYSSSSNRRNNKPKPKSNASRKKKLGSNHVRNPATGRIVKRSSNLGKFIVSLKPKNKNKASKNSRANALKKLWATTPPTTLRVKGTKLGFL